MKKMLLAVLTVFTFCISLIQLGYAGSFNGASFGGATGLISTPTANVGWNTKLGLDISYHYIHEESDWTSSIPKATITLFNMAEVGFAYDMQEDEDTRGNDTILHGKINFYKAGSSALAIGGNYQSIEVVDGGDNFTHYQLYLAATYGGNFATMPAETTIVIGKTFLDDDDQSGFNDSDIDVSMGFDLQLIPSLFKGYVHWINDFANYSYSVDPTGARSLYRGCFNTGIRIAPLKGNKYKLIIDAIIADFFDDADRSFSMGVTFGMAIQ